MKPDSSVKVNFYNPNIDIKWIVRKFETIQYNGSPQIFSDNFIPRPDVGLVFNFKELPEVLAPKNIDLKPIFIATIPIKPLLLSVDGQIDTFVVICKATVFSRVFKINMTNTTPIVDIVDKNILQLYDQLLHRRNDNERIECFSEFITGLLSGKYKPDNIDNIYNDILENSALKPLQQMLEKRFLSISSLQRSFLKRTGVSMKKLVRIARVHGIIESMLKERQFNFKKIFSDSMYYDQSHFIRDFKELTGITPRHFFKENTEMLRFISGIEHNP